MSDNDNSPGNYHDLQWGKIGFEALPAGRFVADGNSIAWSGNSENACFWTADEQHADKAYQRTLSYNNKKIDRSAINKDCGI